MQYDPARLTKSIHENPILVDLCDIAESVTGLRLMVVFPHRDGWGQVIPGYKADRPEFCRLVQSSEQGGRRCRMCHVLMTVAACSREEIEQKCHAGVSVLVIPVDTGNGESVAILSSCHSTSDWEEVKQRGEALGLNLRDLKKTYSKLHRLQNGDQELAKSIMGAAGKALLEIRRGLDLVNELNELKGKGGQQGSVVDSVKYELRSSLSRPEKSNGKKGRKRNGHALVDVVVDLVSSKPAMPYSVFEISAAARMTPNHFSALFKKQMGISFSEFLANRRIELSKELLKDLTLNIAEVAERVGYDDPGYFARRFRQKEKISPRAWRNSLG